MRLRGVDARRSHYGGFWEQFYEVKLQIKFLKTFLETISTN
jgi:hypothetical protein